MESEKLEEFKNFRRIVRHNIDKMISTFDCISEFHKELLEESIGGNAGEYFDKENGMKYPCAAANFYVKENGEIIKFTNDVRNDFPYKMGFRVIVDLGYPVDAKVVGISNLKNKYIPDDLKRVIVGTVAVYNSKLEELAK
tara:strand:+ start:185 stop:604 length:420 start_codon:yes stop_codon:yes gene_type:complete